MLNSLLDYAKQSSTVYNYHIHDNSEQNIHHNKKKNLKINVMNLDACF